MGNLKPLGTHECPAHGTEPCFWLRGRGWRFLLRLLGLNEHGCTKYVYRTGGGRSWIRLHPADEPLSFWRE